MIKATEKPSQLSDTRKKNHSDFFMNSLIFQRWLLMLIIWQIIITWL